MDRLVTMPFLTIPTVECFPSFCGWICEAKVNYKFWVTYNINLGSTVKLGDKEGFDKEKIGVKERYPVTNCQFTL